MKKLLVTSAALLAIAGGSSAVMANTPNVSAGTAAWRPSLKIAGQASFSSHFHNSKEKHQNSGRGRGTHFALEDSTLIFDVGGKADSFSGLEYSWILSIDGDKSKAGESNIQNNYLKLKNDYGTFMAGNHNGVEDAKHGAHSIMGATGGFDGNYKNAINISTGVVATTDHAGRTKRATKVSYWTPRFWGFQAGVSYTPDTKHHGEGKLNSSGNSSAAKYAGEGTAFGQNTWAGIIDFSRALPYGFAVNLSLSGLIGKSKSGNPGANNIVNDAKSWAVGGDVSYTYGDHVFKVGAEYVDNLKTRQVKSLAVTGGNRYFTGNKAGKIWAVAASYKLGSHKIAYGYFNSTRDLGKVTNVVPANTVTNLGRAKADVHSVTYDKDMAPGWSLYGEFNRFRFRTSQNAVNVQNQIKAGNALNSSQLDEGVKGQHGHSVIVGTKIKF